MDTTWFRTFALSPTSLMLEAEITAEGDGRVFCERCKESFPPGTELKYVRNLKGPTELGRKVCEGCHMYYLNKPTTLRRPQDHGEWFLCMEESILILIHYLMTVESLSMTRSGKPQQQSSIRLGYGEIQQMVAAAQRGGMKIFSSLSKPKWHLPIDVSNPIMAVGMFSGKTTQPQVQNPGMRTCIRSKAQMWLIITH